MSMLDRFRKPRAKEPWQPEVTKTMLREELLRRGFVEDDRPGVPQSQLRGFRIEVGPESGSLFLQISEVDPARPDALTAADEWLKGIGRDRQSYGVVHPGPELAIDRHPID